MCHGSPSRSRAPLAAEALVETVVNLYRAGWTVEQVELELAFLSLQNQSEGMQQLKALDRDLLLSFVVSIWITCEVRSVRKPSHAATCLLLCHRNSAGLR